MKTFATYNDKRRAAIKSLVELGAVIYVKDIETYHGRAGNGGEWSVDPNFNNGGNNTGNHNVFKVSALYTSSKDVATRFASARTNAQNPVVELHKIVPQNDDLVIFNRKFDVDDLTEAQKQLFYNSMSMLTSFSVNEILPIKFEYREIYPQVVQAIKQEYPKVPNGIFTDENIENVINALSSNQSIRQTFKNKDELTEFVVEVLSASNSKRFMQLIPKLQINNFLGGCNKLYVKIQEGKQGNVRTNPKYVENLCKRVGIIGTIGNVDSATLDSRIEVVTYFDTTKVATEKQMEEKKQFKNLLFGKISSQLSSVVNNDVSSFFQKASAKEIMQFVSQDTKCKEIFDKSTGLWEGYTVGQHTEAVLDFFDRYKVDELPKEILPFIKVAILAHDIGKGYAADPKSEWYGKHKQANKEMAKILYKSLDVDEKYAKLLDFVFTEAQDFTSKYYFGATNSRSMELTSKQKQYINQGMLKACEDVLKQTLNTNPTDSEIKALQKICIVLQHCDSGAYTRYATINAGSGVFYTGGNDRFTSSFIIGKNGMPRLKTYQDEKVYTV